MAQHPEMCCTVWVAAEDRKPDRLNEMLVAAVADTAGELPLMRNKPDLAIIIAARLYWVLRVNGVIKSNTFPIYEGDKVLFEVPLFIDTRSDGFYVSSVNYARLTKLRDQNRIANALGY